MMDSILKREKLIEEVKIKEGEVDRISNLPRTVIGHILSFLPTKYAVATSVLATKWKYLWTSISSFDFDDELVSNHTQQDNTDPSIKGSFINFVYRVMLQCNVSDIHKYRLKCSQIYDVSHLNAWVCTSLLRNVGELYLIIPMEGHMELPRDLFTSNSLVALKLGTRAVTNGLLLCAEKPENKSDVEWILLHRHARSLWSKLEQLYARQTGNNKLFLIKQMMALFSGLIELNTPNLQHLKYNDYVAEGYSVTSCLNSLVKAYIDIGLYSASGATFADRDSSTEPLAVVELLDGIWNVRWDLLPNVLESSPQLKTLVFEELHLAEREEGHHKHWHSPQRVPSCLLFHLKVIEIKWFTGERDEFNVVKYFLKNAKVLKKLAMHTARYGKLKLCKKLLMLPRDRRIAELLLLFLDFSPLLYSFGCLACEHLFAIVRGICLLSSMHLFNVKAIFF
ncbi:putative FBD-associated F-box protein At3g50710 [Cornus florida]|uniref:putative FBD-associated F-box protein At3g50710 n=1 Tax=Cornus florida TaxID=4283 RepID=UPI00289A0705|nr:putative FBD-associated F-box protein At3g50710 [Cornus florida]